MKKEKRKEFNLPYIGISRQKDIPLLYGQNGEFSCIVKIENPVEEYSASIERYESYHHLLLNIIKVLGEGYIIQKQDVFARKKFQPSSQHSFLANSFQQHFRDRAYTEISSYLVITRQVKKGAFYVYDAKILADYLEFIHKVLDLLKGGGLSPEVLNEQQIDRYIHRLLCMDFSSGKLCLDNFRVTDKQLNIGERVCRVISLVDTDVVELPEQIQTFKNRNDGQVFKDFPQDNLSFLHRLENYDCMVYNQLIEIPSQAIILNKLELKRKRHSGIPDPANKMCVEDIDRLMVDVARENQLLVNVHYSLLVCAKADEISKASNFIESELFLLGIIPSRNAYNQLELFRCCLPGNATELKKYDWFLTTCDAALCYFFKESLKKTERSDFLIHFTDRQGIPIGIDPADLPMTTGRINNRNKFVLGPSGSGKSFFMNALIEQMMGYNMDVVIIDTGHSYSGLCEYFKGIYKTYSEKEPITMNPFVISEEEYNVEKKDFLKTLLGLLLKGVDGEISQVEDAVFSNVITAFYADYFTGGNKRGLLRLDFDSFYNFSIHKIAEIKQQDGIRFDLDEYRYVLRKFCRGGEFGSLLNEQSDSSLFQQRFIVYEIDAIKENKILFPIVTLIIMDVFLQKMRHRSSQRKALICEEAWKAIASPLMSGYLLYLYKTVRKFWGEAIVVTQELGDILGNAVVKDSILNNSDTVCLLDQSKFKDNYSEVAKLLSLSEVEQKKIFTINGLDNKKGRGKFKEVYIKRGAYGEVYGVEVSLEQYICYTTEKPEKMALEKYADKLGDFEMAVKAFVQDFRASGLSLNAFVTAINNTTT
ncbi:TraG family conjugative transposon ATPase [Pedobacter aquatilis]|uniref:TraG family conjugative transposon ATPase n=1 Tax=Pedobacter aquatilis TaxID=351343 RepID=UPI00292EAAA0|nr:TraG family conjugative transposon ATPase [Pedobacter aquatilis]